jgi:PAS domain S-box-containing protein
MSSATGDRYRAIFESAVDFAMIATDRDGQVTDWNTGAERVLGWSVAEMVGQNLDRIFTPEDRAQGRRLTEMQVALDHGRAADERWHMRADGGRFWSSGELMPLRGSDGSHLGFLKIIRDRTEQRLAQEALREARGLNDLIFHSSRDCIVVLDLDGHTVSVSPGGVESMEISDVQAIIGLSWLRVWKGADNEAARAAVAAARAGGVGRFEGFCPTHKGTPKWWDVAISPLPGPDGRPERLVSIGRDVSDRVRAQQLLAFSDETLRLATEAAEIGTWNADFVADTLTWSDRTKAMFGVAPDANVTLEDFYAGLHPEDRDAVAEAFASAIDPDTRATYDVEYRTIGREDGVVRWVAARGRGMFDAEGRCSRAIGTAIDVTGLRATEARLRQSERALRELNATLERRVAERTAERDRNWNNSQDLLAVLDGAGRLRAVNPAWTRVLGWEAQELVGRELRDFVHAEDVAASSEALAQAALARLSGFENRCRHKHDDAHRWISWVASPEEGLIYASGRHVTAEKEAAAALASMQEQLRQSQKMEAVGQLTGGIAHDFNNLLTGIIGSLELLQSRIARGETDNVGRYISAAQGAAKRAASLTQRLLAFSRRQMLDPRPTDVGRLVADMEDLIRRTVGPGVALEMSLLPAPDGAPWLAQVDPNQLENALLNLCINARDAMPEGGQLIVRTETMVCDEAAAASLDLPPGEYVGLLVADTGVGMSEDVLARAFDPFFTTKPMGQGTGLGLSMIYGFARQSGGQVRAHSVPGQGTSMQLYFPRAAPGSVATSAAAAETAQPVRAAAGRVLVVDDEPSVRLLIAEVLEAAGLSVAQAAEGGTALAELNGPGEIDVLITDVGLPGGMNGRQLADAARAMRPGLKVLFITGYAETAVRLGPDTRVLTKPFAMETLAASVCELLGTTT